MKAIVSIGCALFAMSLITLFSQTRASAQVCGSGAQASLFTGGSPLTSAISYSSATGNGDVGVDSSGFFAGCSADKGDDYYGVFGANFTSTLTNPTSSAVTRDSVMTIAVFGYEDYQDALCDSEIKLYLSIVNLPLSGSTTEDGYYYDKTSEYSEEDRTIQPSGVFTVNGDASGHAMVF